MQNFNCTGFLFARFPGEIVHRVFTFCGQNSERNDVPLPKKEESNPQLWKTLWKPCTTPGSPQISPGFFRFCTEILSTEKALPVDKISGKPGRNSGTGRRPQKFVHKKRTSCAENPAQEAFRCVESSSEAKKESTEVSHSVDNFRCPGVEM